MFPVSDAAAVDHAAVSEGNSNVFPARETRIDPATTVGGQAVIEGVMMRAPSAWAVAIRQPDGGITARRNDLTRLSERNRWARVPFVRGIFVLGESLTLGFKALSWSAQVATEEEEKPLTGAQIGLTMVLAFVFFAGVFILLPAFAADFASNESDLLFSVIEGAIRLGLFVGYIWLIGRSKEIARVFEYHGAEHMSIHAYEAGDPLTVESVRRYPPEHPRCGTSFLLIVVLGSIILFSFLGQPGIFFLVVSRLIGIPIIAGIAYELLRWSGTRPDGWLANALAKPGIWLQKLTTAVPAEDQIEVAISSLVVALDDERLASVVARGDLYQPALQVREAARSGDL